MGCSILVRWHLYIDSAPWWYHMALMNWVIIGSGNGLHYSGSCHYLNQWSLFSKEHLLSTKPKWNSNQNTKMYVQEIAFKNVVSRVPAILYCIKPVDCDISWFVACMWTVSIQPEKGNVIPRNWILGPFNSLSYLSAICHRMLCWPFNMKLFWTFQDFFWRNAKMISISYESLSLIS